MPKDPGQKPHPPPENDKQLGTPERGKFHWTKDLEVHPGRDDEDEDEPHRRKPDTRNHH